MHFSVLGVAAASTSGRFEWPRQALYRIKLCCTKLFCIAHIFCRDYVPSR
jgi:hypothetical protein